MVRVWALIEVGDREAIELFVRREDGEQALADCLSDEPQWRGLLRLEEIGLAGASGLSLNRAQSRPAAPSATLRGRTAGTSREAL